MIYSHLLSPIKIGKLELRNRFYQPSMGMSKANPDGTAGPCQLEYYKTRAAGGFAICTVDYCFIAPEGRAIPNQLGIDADDKLEGLSQIVDAIHAEGAIASVQLCHAGRSTMPQITGFPTYGPSPLPCKMYKTIPTELSVAQIHEIVKKFGEAARRAKRAGFDCVELHMGHTYLIDQFLDPWSNRRTDEFGGSLENRSLLARLVLREVKEACGEDFPILCKISAEDGQPGGTRINDSCAVASILEANGADAIVVSIGGYGRFDLITAPFTYPEGFNLGNAEKIRKCVSIPVIGLGRMNDPDTMETALRSGKCDIISLGRQSLTDPELPKKVAEGRTEEIFHCMGCNQACVHENAAAPEEFGISCMLNPFSAREYKMNFAPAATPKKIVIAGASAAGLECAWVAARRGHKVIVFEQQPQAGGQFRVASMPPYKQGISKAIATMLTMCEKYGVEIRYDTEATEGRILAEKPDAVVLATGGVPLEPPIPGIRDEGVLRAIDVASGRVYTGERCIVLGGGLVGVELADMLSEQDKHVTVIERLPAIGMDEHFSIQMQRHKNFAERGVQIHVNTTITKIEKDAVECTSAAGEALRIEADSVIVALGAAPHDPLAALEGKVPELYKIGDCAKARQAKHAIYDGAVLGVKL